jgi:hypothetical protein
MYLAFFSMFSCSSSTLDQRSLRLRPRQSALFDLCSAHSTHDDHSSFHSTRGSSDEALPISRSVPPPLSYLNTSFHQCSDTYTTNRMTTPPYPDALISSRLVDALIQASEAEDVFGVCSKLREMWARGLLYARGGREGVHRNRALFALLVNFERVGKWGGRRRKEIDFCYSRWASGTDR